MLALVGTARTSCAVRALLWRVLPAACPPLHRRILDARTRGLGGAVLHGCRCTCAAGPENNDADGNDVDDNYDDDHNDGDNNNDNGGGGGGGGEDNGAGGIGGGNVAGIDNNADNNNNNNKNSKNYKNSKNNNNIDNQNQNQNRGADERRGVDGRGARPGAAGPGRRRAGDLCGAIIPVMIPSAPSSDEVVSPTRK
jgi:hypothetical protein